MYLLRTKFKGEIVCEFLPPKKTSNKVMIFCSGMPGYPDREKYKKICEQFGKIGYWCFIPRYRGSWESGGTMFKNSPERDILDIMDELPKGFKDYWDGKKYIVKNPEVTIFGSSFGGPVALLCSHDKRVKKVIAFSPVIDWREEKNTVEPIPKMAKWVADVWSGGYRIAKDGWKKIERGQIYNPATELQKIDGRKCLIFHAKDDDVVSIKPLKPFVDKTGAKLVLFKTGGHLGMSVLEKRFYKTCMKFLKSKPQDV